MCVLMSGIQMCGGGWDDLMCVLMKDDQLLSDHTESG